MSQTHYQTLGVDDHAGGAKIKRHYYELCKKYHPDVAGGDTQKMAAINEAYRVLSDTTEKSRYDRELATARRQTASASTQTASWPYAQQPKAAPQPFRHAQPTARKQKGTGLWWFMALGGGAAVLIIAISYLAPFPKVATATTTPSVTTTADSSGQPTDTVAASTPDITMSPTTTSTTTPSDITQSGQAPNSATDTTQPTQNTTTPVPPAPTHKHRLPRTPYIWGQ